VIYFFCFFVFHVFLVFFCFFLYFDPLFICLFIYFATQGGVRRVKLDAIISAHKYHSVVVRSDINVAMDGGGLWCNRCKMYLDADEDWEQIQNSMFHKRGITWLKENVRCDDE